MKRVAVYLRVSTARQEDEETIESQMSELQKRIDADGFVLDKDKIYRDDGWTGTLLERPDLDRLRQDARDEKIDMLYFYDRGRIARKFVYQAVVLDELQQLGIECISLKDINGSSPEQQLMGNVFGAFHEYERLKISERMRLGKMRKVRDNGKLLGYNPKYGYIYHPRIKGTNGKDGYLSIDEKEAEVVNYIFEWFIESQSIREVIRRLHSNGIPPKKQMSSTWTKGPIVRMLRDSTYIGKHYYNKTEAVETKKPRDPAQKYRRVKKNSRIQRPKEEWLLVEVPRIINDELFSKAQILLDNNVKFAKRNNKKNEYLLTGIVNCECGKPRTGDPASNGSTYYRCTDRLSRFPLERQCHAGGVNSKVLDSVIWQQIKVLITNPMELHKQAVRWISNNQSLSTKKTIEVALNALKALDSEERRYVKAFGGGYMSERLYKEQINEINEKRSNLESELNDAKKQLKETPTLTVEQLVAGVQKILENLDFTDKKAIIRELVSKIKATQGEVIIWGQLPVLQKSEVGFEPKYRNRGFA
jgi:site-specific DNA recombinase